MTFENEAIAICAELGADKFAAVYPSLSIGVAAPVAVAEGWVNGQSMVKH